MKLSFLFARRYLFSKKTINAINIISSISIIGVMVSSAALVIVLSFYNGMENFILSLDNALAPELRIEPERGKTFVLDEKQLSFIDAINGVQSTSKVLEDKVLINKNNIQAVGLLKGIEPSSLSKELRQKMLYTGDFSLKTDSVSYALIGSHIQAKLNLPIMADRNSLFDLYSPRKGTYNSINPLENINSRVLMAEGLLNYHEDFDQQILVSLDFARDILSEPLKVSALEVYCNTENIKAIQKEIQAFLGDKFIVKNREQVNPTLYKTVKSEKWIVFFIVTLIGIIALFNIIGSLTMLVIDKKNDMMILRSLGGSNALIQNIFFIEGVLIAFIGSFIGIVVGYTFCVLQETYGLVRTNSAGSMLDVYPIDIRSSDFILVSFTIILLSTGVSYVASKLNVKEFVSIKSSNR